MDQKNSQKKIFILHKAIYKFKDTDLIKITMAFSTEIEKTLKFVWSHKRSQIVTVLLRKNDAESITFPDSKRSTSYSKQRADICYWHNKHIDQWDKRESIKLPTYKVT